MIALVLLLCTLSVLAVPITRREAEECGRFFTDLDCDGRVSRHEIEQIRHASIAFKFGSKARLVEGVASVLSLFPSATGVESVDDVLRDCGDKYGYVTPESHKEKKDTCLNTESKLQHAYDYVCEPGSLGAFNHLYSASKCPEKVAALEDQN